MDDDKSGGSSSRVSRGDAGPSSSLSPAVAGAAAPSTSSLGTATAPVVRRQRFSVDLRPGETTIVSWKRLIRDSRKAAFSEPTAPPEEPPTGAHPALESRIAPGQSADCELKDELPAPNRFSAVIEKIERLYMGNQSSDEEKLDEIPDDDQYDTEDSFIDDAELDEYFQVDKSAIKHNGFFVNRGKLERLNVPVPSPDNAPKKRRRKDLIKAHREKDGENMPNKHLKMGNVRMKTAARSGSLVASKSSSPSRISTSLSEHYQEAKYSNNHLKTGHSKKKFAELPRKTEHSLSMKMPNEDAFVFPMEAKDIEKQKTGLIQSRDVESSEAKHQAFRDTSIPLQVEPQSRKVLDDANGIELSTKNRHMEKNGNREIPDLNSSASKYAVQTIKSPSLLARPKGTMLERAIRELEKIVAESRPPTMEVQEGDVSYQGVKRRLPRDVKQKLAKVARLAQSSQGKISEELITRLMSILGHLVQLKTLKRNLREMIELGLSAKQEKDNRFQQIKREVIDMIRMRVPSLKAKVAEQQDLPSDDFQEMVGSEEKGVLKRKYSMDDAMEDKICDLYDLYVEGMDEDKGPQIRKLYVELAELWPNGFMDNVGIKGAVYRAKERKRKLYNRHKVEEKIKRKKNSSAVRAEEIARGEARLNAQARAMQERLPTDSSTHTFTTPNGLISGLTTTNQQLGGLKSSLTSTNQQLGGLKSGLSSTNQQLGGLKYAPPATSKQLALSGRTSNPSGLDRPKQEKVRGIVSTVPDELMGTTEGAILKKKLKKKTEPDLVDIPVNPVKLPSNH